MSDLSQCKCGARVLFMKTRNGKIILVDFKIELASDEIFDGKRMANHFKTCPDVDQFRKKKK